MQVMLQITAGPHHGQQVCPQAGLVSQFGQTDWADFSFPEDASMAEYHFSLDCRDRRCILQTLGDTKTWVNDTEVQQQLLMPGDRIRAGETEFAIAIEGMAEDLLSEPEDESTDDAAMAATTVAMLSAEEICERLQLKGEAPALASEATSPIELSQLLGDREDYAQAIRVRSYLLGNRSAVAWGCHLVGQVFQDSLDPIQAAGLAAAVAWTHQAEPQQCRAAEAAAVHANHGGPGGMISAAAFWSGDNLAPESSPEPIPPDETLYTQGVVAALVMALYHQPQPPPNELFQHFMEVASAIEAGDLILYQP